jgi:hypothetical protein
MDKCRHACTHTGTDACTHVGTDTGTDVGMDAGMDMGMDAGTDAGMDAGTDVSMDVGMDIRTHTWHLVRNKIVIYHVYFIALNIENKNVNPPHCWSCE